MARIAGINIPPHKHAEIGLTSIYGIGRRTAQKICDAAGVPWTKKIKDLNDADLEKIRAKGAVLAPLPAADKAQLATISATVRNDWAQTLDSRGRAGSEVLKAFMDAMK